ncbi:MAG: DUF438 domain-containing protein [Fidelibacterota bacterium]|nr:MAG: DUF438 domain-containing protein [Candidatus Neomarinimicrobiota bacterium]
METREWDRLLVGEHEMIERAMDVLRKELEILPDMNYNAFTMQRAIDFLLEFGDRIHNTKEEKVLFPLMVERGIPEDGPIRVMLLEHESERKILQQMLAEITDLEKAAEEARAGFRRNGIEYLEIRANHIWKENDVLYQMGRQIFTEEDNQFLVEGFGGIDTSTYGETAAQHYYQMLEEVEQGSKARKSLIHNLSLEQIDAIMETLPVEVTFVDADDTVAYFNRLDKEKIFDRTRSVVGRKVQQCHPEKSLHRVQQIIDGFKGDSLEKADFWIDFAGDKVLIRYFPVRDEEGSYLGVLEVTQRIGEIQKLTGEKKLLD